MMAVRFLATPLYSALCSRRELYTRGKAPEDWTRYNHRSKFAEKSAMVEYVRLLRHSDIGGNIFRSNKPALVDGYRSIHCSLKHQDVDDLPALPECCEPRWRGIIVRRGKPDWIIRYRNNESYFVRIADLPKSKKRIQ